MLCNRTFKYVEQEQMEGRRAHFAANMEGMSMMVVDGNHPEDGGFWNPPLHTLLHPRTAIC